jgi:hypothetical protein
MLNQTGIVSPQSRDRGPRFNRREQPNALIEPFPLPSQFRSDGGQFGPFPDLRPRNHLVWSQSELKGIGGEPLETSDLVQRGTLLQALQAIDKTRAQKNRRPIAQQSLMQCHRQRECSLE